MSNWFFFICGVKNCRLRSKICNIFYNIYHAIAFLRSCFDKEDKKESSFHSRKYQESVCRSRRKFCSSLKLRNLAGRNFLRFLSKPQKLQKFLPQTLSSSKVFFTRTNFRAFVQKNRLVREILYGIYAEN